MSPIVEPIARLLHQLPIRRAIPLAVTLPTVALVVVLAVLAFNQAKRVTGDLSRQLVTEINERIKLRLDGYMRVPQQVNQLNLGLIREGVLDPTRVADWETHVIQQQLAFDSVSSITFGNAAGEVIWTAKYPGENTFDLALKTDQTGPLMLEFKVDEGGDRRIAPDNRVPFDAATRPWFAEPIRAGEPIWLDAYAWLRDGETSDVLGLGYAQPVYANQERSENSEATDELIGVLDTELTLVALSEFLASLDLGSGYVFIVEAGESEANAAGKMDGALIATSGDAALVDDDGDRVLAQASEDAPIRLAAEEVLRALGSFQAASTAKQLDVSINGEAVRLDVWPYKLPGGLNWRVVTVVPERDFMGAVYAGRRMTLVAGLAVVLGTLLLGIRLGLSLAKPVMKVVDHVNLIGDGDLDTELKIDANPEYMQLAGALNSMSHDLKEKMRMERSLAVARDVQQNLLPENVPTVAGLEIAAVSDYCDETGGDYYDFLNITGLGEGHDGEVSIVLGDAVDHGIAAAMLMATVRGILISKASDSGSLAELLNHVNQVLHQNSRDMRFMTMMMMHVDRHAGKVRWAGAGQDPTLLYDPETEAFQELRNDGFPLGLVEEAEYEEEHLNTLKPGQLLVIASDGVRECMNPEREKYGEERFRDFVKRHAAGSVDELAEALREELAAFREGSAQTDDITFVILRVV